MGDPTDFGERALSAAQTLLRRGQEAARREARVIRLQTQISRLRSRRQNLLLQMGQKVYDLFQRDLVRNHELRMLCQQVRGIDAEIELKREEIAQLRRPEVRERGIDEERAREAGFADEEDPGVP